MCLYCLLFRLAILLDDQCDYVARHLESPYCWAFRVSILPSIQCDYNDRYSFCVYCQPFIISMLRINHYLYIDNILTSHTSLLARCINTIIIYLSLSPDGCWASVHPVSPVQCVWQPCSCNSALWCNTTGQTASCVAIINAWKLEWKETRWIITWIRGRRVRQGVQLRRKNQSTKTMDRVQIDLLRQKNQTNPVPKQFKNINSWSSVWISYWQGYTSKAYWNKS